MHPFQMSPFPSLNVICGFPSLRLGSEHAVEVGGEEESGLERDDGLVVGEPVGFRARKRQQEYTSAVHDAAHLEGRTRR